MTLRGCFGSVPISVSRRLTQYTVKKCLKWNEKNRLKTQTNGAFLCIAKVWLPAQVKNNILKELFP